jgi:RNA polymerase sigma-70 factor, ECF subfamily
MNPDNLIQRDAHLMQRIAAGDMKASREIVGLHMDRAYRSAFHLLNNHAQAEDIIQEAFLRLWKSAAKWEAKAQVSTWLHRVVHNLCIDSLRKEKRYGDDEVPDIADNSPTPVQARATAQVANVLHEGMAELPARQRVAITLVHFDECGNKDAAKRMGISVDALESLLARGRRKLKDILTPRRAELDGDLT